jgi:hypothetical protein
VDRDGAASVIEHPYLEWSGACHNACQRRDNNTSPTELASKDIELQTHFAVALGQKRID